ncbi:MAG: lysozyme inhibitor LprI family protein [Methylobacter sp.]|nr:lysozyme inhibitor LprI family protein [Methylobacter sp.]
MKIWFHVLTAICLPDSFILVFNIRAALLAILLLLSACIFAAEDESPLQCRYDGNQQEMNACAVRDYKAADRALNDEYKKLMTLLPPVEQQRLRQDQRAWLKRRDPHCKAEAKLSEGGSIWPLEFSGCLRVITGHRTGELKKINDGPLH